LTPPTEQFAGGTLVRNESSGEVSASGMQSAGGAGDWASALARVMNTLCLAFSKLPDEPVSPAPITNNCTVLPARVFQFEGQSKTNESFLTPELKQFIDHVIVPILVEQYLAEHDARDRIAEGRLDVKKLRSKPAAGRPGEHD
jgi:hypothetical protein